MMTSEPDGTQNRLTVLAFTLGDDHYCVPVDAVSSVVGVTDASSLEAAPDPWNAGTISVEETQVRVVDLPRIVTPGSHTIARVDEPALLVLRQTTAGETHYGWLVDDVDATTTVRRSDLEEPRTSARLVRGRLEIDDTAVLVLDEDAMHG